MFKTKTYFFTSPVEKHYKKWYATIKHIFFFFPSVEHQVAELHRNHSSTKAYFHRGSLCNPNCDCKICVLYQRTLVVFNLFLAIPLNSCWWVALTIITVIDINLSICVHIIGVVGGAGGGRFCCRLCVSILQLLQRPWNGCRSPARSMAVPGMDRLGRGS